MTYAVSGDRFGEESEREAIRALEKRLAGAIEAASCASVRPTTLQQSNNA
jgi:hypothetical protein